jgi:hypothetical protein
MIHFGRKTNFPRGAVLTVLFVVGGRLPVIRITRPQTEQAILSAAVSLSTLPQNGQTTVFTA